MRHTVASLCSLFLALVVLGCGGGGGSRSSTSGGSTGGSTDGTSDSFAVASHLSYTVGVPAQDYAPSTSPQDVRLLVGSDIVVVSNAIVTKALTSVSLETPYALLNAGSKPMSGARSSNTMVAIEGGTTYSVPLDKDGATTRPILFDFGQSLFYPLSSIKGVSITGGLQLISYISRNVPGSHSADLSGSFKIDGLGVVSGPATFTFDGGGNGGADLYFYKNGSANFGITAPVSASSPVSETFVGGVNSDRTFTNASLTYFLP